MLAVRIFPVEIRIIFKKIESLSPNYWADIITKLFIPGENRQGNEFPSPCVLTPYGCAG